MTRSKDGSPSAHSDARKGLPELLRSTKYDSVVDLQYRTIRIQPGGAKNPHRIRVIPLNEIAFTAVDRALELARKRGSKDPDHYLFP
jgi:hypothetical protein